MSLISVVCRTAAFVVASALVSLTVSPRIAAAGQCATCSACTSCGSNLSGEAKRIDCETLRVTVCDSYSGPHPVVVWGYINNQHQTLATTTINIPSATSGVSCQSADIRISLPANGQSTYLWVHASSPSGTQGYIFDPTQRRVDSLGNAVMSFAACTPPTPTPTPTPTPCPVTVTPIAECIDVNEGGTITAHFAYRNTGQKELTVPVGADNFLSPGAANRGQPTTFATGLVSNSFQVTFPSNQSLSWTVGGTTATASISTTRCEGDNLECVETDNKGNLASIDNKSKIQRNKVLQISHRVLRITKTGSAATTARRYIDQARKLYLVQWSDLWASFPQVSISCLGVGCATIDNTNDIAEVEKRSRAFVRLARQAAALLKKTSNGRQSSVATKLLRDTQRLSSQISDRTAELPRFESKCQ